MAFKAARAADPSAKLIYNDTENQRSDGLTTALTQQIVKRLHSEGLIDMVGLQMHLDASYYATAQDVINTMRSYGVPVAITEFDIDLNTVKGTQASRLALQAKIASETIQACRQSKVCKEITFWGIEDDYSWLREAVSGEKNAAPTMFDNNRNPKPFYYAVRKALS
jgi:endo-1,4-beta-xylanase